MTVFDEELSDEFNLNKQYMGYKIKEFRLAHTVEQKKILQKNLLKLDQKITKLKTNIEPNYNIDQQRFIRSPLNYSPMSRGRLGKIPKMSEDIVA
jgi:hypothetical protein